MLPLPVDLLFDSAMRWVCRHSQRLDCHNINAPIIVSVKGTMCFIAVVAVAEEDRH